MLVWNNNSIAFVPFGILFFLQHPLGLVVTNAQSLFYIHTACLVEFGNGKDMKFAPSDCDSFASISLAQ